MSSKQPELAKLLEFTLSQRHRLLSCSDILKSAFAVYQKAQVLQVKSNQGHDLNSTEVLSGF